MTSAAKSWLKRVLVTLAALALLYPLSFLIPELLGAGISLFFLLLMILGYLVLVVGLPFFFWIIGEAVYRVLIKPYVRAYHIRRIRNTRYLREAVERGRPSG